MTSLIEILDTTIKIGLGGLIAAASGYVAARKSHRESLEKLRFEDKNALLKEAALKLENIEGKSNSSALALHAGNIPEAKREAVLGINEAYAVAALTNLAGSHRLLEISSQLSELMESIYHELNENNPSEDILCKIDEQLSIVKKQAYEHFRSAYASLA